MAYRVRLSKAALADLELIFDHLAESYEALGETPEEALARAAARIRTIQAQMEGLGDVPHQGTLWPELMEGLRWTTKDRTIFYFLVDDKTERLDVLALFFGGQDHKAHILSRIISQNPAQGDRS